MALIDTKIALPSTGGGVNKNGTPVITGTNGYGDYFTITGVNNTPTTPISVGNTSPVLVGGNTGNIYGDVLTPTLAPELTEPVYSPIIGSGSVGGNLLKPVDPSQYFDGSVVGTVGGGFSSGNSGGVTDEGVITKTPNADDVTFNNNGFTGTGTPQITPTNGVSGGTSSNSGTATGTGAGASTDTGTGTGDSTPTTPKDTEEKTTMSYEEYIAEQKAREEEKRQAALKEAEIYKERAAADAQASYMQNMSTYGVNAETMAQMGLTGGGYSDYLNAQAYAQKRGEMQTASANELALKQQAETKYADNILSLDGQLLAYQEAEKAEKEQYAKSVYNTLWEAVQDPNTTYTADSIKAIAEKAGLSDEDISTLTGMLDSTLAKKAADEKKAQDDKAAAEEEQKATYSAGIKSDAMAQIEANGGMSVEYINSLKGYGLSDADMAEVIKYNQKYTYNSYKSAITGGYTVNTSDIDTAYNDGLLDATQYNSLKSEWNKSIDTSTSFFKYNGETISYDDAKKAIENLSNNAWATSETKKAVESSFMRVYAQDIAKNSIVSGLSSKKVQSSYVDIYADNFKSSQFGDYADGDEQDALVAAYIRAAQNGEIPVGKVCEFNYGEAWNDHGYYVYIGDGVFVKYDDAGTLSSGTIYYPFGFKKGTGYRITKSDDYGKWAGGGAGGGGGGVR